MARFGLVRPVLVLLGGFLALHAEHTLADLDCPDFRYQEDAQEYFESNGGSASYNFDRLDADGNGLACERLPHRVLSSGSSSTNTDGFDEPNTPFTPYETPETKSERNVPWIPIGLAACGGIYYWRELHGPQNRRARPSPGRTYDPKKMDYQDYLHTPEWMEIRQMAFTRDGYKCTKCGRSDNLQAHHLNYRRRGHEKVKDLTTLCASCHAAEHGKRKPWRAS